MFVYVGVIHWRGTLRDAIVETALSEEGVVYLIRRIQTQAEQRGSEFYDREGNLVAFYVRRYVGNGEKA